MRNVTSVLLVSSLLFVAPVMAATGHDHGAGGHSHGSISSNEVIVKATQKVKSLVESAKLDKNWADIKADGAKTQGNEWVVTFKDAKVSDVSKQTLYVFFSLDGVYIATNFTGK